MGRSKRGVVLVIGESVHRQRPGLPHHHSSEWARGLNCGPSETRSRNSCSPANDCRGAPSGRRMSCRTNGHHGKRGMSPNPAPEDRRAVLLDRAHANPSTTRTHSRACRGVPKDCPFSDQQDGSCRHCFPYTKLSRSNSDTARNLLSGFPITQGCRRACPAGILPLRLGGQRIDPYCCGKAVDLLHEASGF